ncbi:MAG TPA: tetratricopeptide repeat protein [Chitinophagaceae bacterium]
MSDKKHAEDMDSGAAAIAKAKDFWTRNNKPIMIACAVVILLGGGWLVYKNFFKNPKEAKAAEAMFRAESYYRMDSLNLALNGDGQNLGFLKVISKYDGTEAANQANYYAGVIYIKLDQNEKAIKHLKEFSTSSKQVQARAYSLMGDAYADMGKGKDALEYYKKAAHHFEEDKFNSADALFRAAYLAEQVLNDKEEAIKLYKEIKEKYPAEKGNDADLHLAKLGVYNVN